MSYTKSQKSREHTSDVRYSAVAGVVGGLALLGIAHVVIPFLTEKPWKQPTHIMYFGNPYNWPWILQSHLVIDAIVAGLFFWLFMYTMLRSSSFTQPAAEPAPAPVFLGLRGKPAKLLLAPCGFGALGGAWGAVSIGWLASLPGFALFSLFLIGMFALIAGVLGIAWLFGQVVLMISRPIWYVLQPTWFGQLLLRFHNKLEALDVPEDQPVPADATSAPPNPHQPRVRK
jgi:hypothetical protein